MAAPLDLAPARPCGKVALLFRQATQYAAVGVVNTLVGFSIIYLGKLVFGLGDVAANAAGYSVGFVIGFFLNKRLTFEHRGPTIAALARYVVVFLIAYCANLATVLFAIEGLGIDGYFAQPFGAVPYSLTFFTLSKLYAFRPPSAQA